MALHGVGQDGAGGNGGQQLAADGGKAAGQPAGCVGKNELHMAAGQHQQIGPARRILVQQGQGFRLFAPHDVHGLKVPGIHRFGCVFYAGKKGDGHRADAGHKAGHGMGGQVCSAGGGGAVRDLAQAQVRGDHTAGQYLAHLVPLGPGGGEDLFQAAFDRGFQPRGAAGDGGIAHAGLRLGGG